MSQLRAVIMQASAQPDEVAVFVFDRGRLRGPSGFSNLGMRIQNEQSGSTSLFAQPMAIEAIPEAAAPGAETETKLARGVLEARMEMALAKLEEKTAAPSGTIRQGHLALLKRWYYRPEARRVGEIFFPDAEGRWPLKAMLRGAGRIAGKMIAAGAAQPVH
jgi:hypothetical protein